MGLTFAEKLLAFKVGRESVQPGQIVEVSPDVAMSHDNAGLVIRQFRQIGVKKVWDPSKIVIPLTIVCPPSPQRQQTLTNQ